MGGSQKSYRNVETEIQETGTLKVSGKSGRGGAEESGEAGKAVSNQRWRRFGGAFR